MTRALPGSRRAALVDDLLRMMQPRPGASPGEAPLVTGWLELREECGIEAASWHHLATVHPCVGYSDERIGSILRATLPGSRGT